MDTYSVVLFLHILFVVVAFGAAAIMHVTLFELRAARTMAEVRQGVTRMARVEKVFPISALLFFLAGAYLIHERFFWSDGWLIASIFSVIVMEALGGTFLKSAVKKLHQGVEANPGDGPVPASLRSMVLDRPTWMAAHLASALSIGVLFLMTNKPSGTTSAFVVIVFAVLGVASAVPPSAARLESPSTIASTD